MQLIKLNATTSTNSYLKQLAQEKQLGDFTVVVCDHQTQGRGQKGNSWISEEGKNLTVSFLKNGHDVKVNQSFTLNCLVSLAIYDVLNELSIPEVRVKWPNDIMSGNKKLCGILIENTLSGYFIKQSIIGFGLNVNQTHFNDLPHVTSMKLESGLDYNLDELLEKILNRMMVYFDDFKNDKYLKIRKKYESVLYRKDFDSKFIIKNGMAFIGAIRGITDSGLLQVEMSNGKLEDFNFKEIQLVY